MNRFMCMGLFAMLSLLILSVEPLLALRVSPGSFTAMGLPVGKTKDMGVPFTVVNTGQESIKVVLDYVRISTVKQDWLEGYQELPDPTWLHVEAPDTIYLGPKGQASFKLIWNCPDAKDLYNQRWVAAIIAKSVGGMFQTALVPQYFLETEINDTLETALRGDWGPVPSGLRFPTLVTNSQKATVRLYNRTSAPITCDLNLGEPDTVGRTLKIESTGGYSWVIPAKGLTFPAKVTVEANGMATIPISFQPAMAALPPNSETLLKITSGKTMRFVRLRFAAPPTEK